MTSVVVSKADEIRELTIDELEQAGGGLVPLVIGVVVYGCLGYAIGMTFFP
jgi:hypothetical protein